MALGTDERGLLGELNKRLEKPIPPVEVTRDDAPVQEVVLRENEADLCALPAHLQHGEDGAPYISASIDFAKFPNGHTNVGCRRIMLRGPRSAGIDLIAPSDLRAIYVEAAGRNEPLPVAYVVGAHPADFMAAMFAIPGVDELDVIGAVRGAPVPVVKCITSTSACRRMPNTCSKAISIRAATPSRKGRMANSSAITAWSNATRCSG